MKESVITNCEKNYVLKALENHTRLDGRAFDEFREVKITFGRDWGCCYVCLGETRVLAQVSCEVQQPKSSRPSEGVLNLNIELSPMGAPQFEPGRQSELSVVLNRMLEKCIKDSKAVDLESLCIKVNEKVWALRVDINVLNYEGNLLDCASVAALAAIAHFRRPDVTCDGEDFVIHTFAQRDPIPTVIHHYPVCITFALFNKGNISISDPTLLEEGVSESQLIIGVNAYKEICGLHLGGRALTKQQLILQCATKAARRAGILVEQIKEAIETDNKSRSNNEDISFEQCIQNDKGTSSYGQQLSLCLDKWSVQTKAKRVSKNKKEEMDVDEQPTADEHSVISLGDSSAVLIPEPVGEGGESKWVISSEEDSESDVEIVSTPEKKIDTIEISGGSSEEEDVIILSSEMGNGTKRKK